VIPEASGLHPAIVAIPDEIGLDYLMLNLFGKYGEKENPQNYGISSRSAAWAFFGGGGTILFLERKGRQIE